MLRVMILQLTVLVVLSVSTIGYKIGGELCPFPTNLKTNFDFNWQSKSGEWANTATPTDYIMLALSWSPTFCASLSQSARDKEFQCIHSNTFGLIVHGLWPQAAKAANVRAHPRNCRNEPQLNTTFIKRFYCIMPDEDLMQSQWEKHGTCYYKTATDYYQVTEQLFRNLNIPDFKTLNGTTTAAAVESAFLSLNSPKLFSSAVTVQMGASNRLREVRICHNLRNQFTACV